MLGSSHENDGRAGHPARVLDSVVVALVVILGLHVLAVLVTGGYAVHLPGRTFEATGIVFPLVLALGLAVIRILLGGRAMWSRHAGALVFSLLLVAYLTNGMTLGSGDTMPARYLPFSILREGDFTLDEFSFLYRAGPPYFVRAARGHYVSEYPVVAALLALPFYLPSVLGRVPPEHPLVEHVEKLAAATFVALSALILFLALRRTLAMPTAFVIAIVYGLCTSSLSVSSQALWQHSASQLALAAVLYCLVRGRTEPRWVGLAGLPLSVAVVTRPTDAVMGLALAAYVLVHVPRQLGWFALGGLPPLAFHFWYNYAYFGDPFRLQFFGGPTGMLQQFTTSNAHWSTPPVAGLAGLLVSPARGLLVYSPVLLFSLAGMWMAWRRGTDPILRYMSAGVILTLLLYSRWVAWHGGETYGPRLLADLLPSLALLLGPPLSTWGRRRVWRCAFVVAALLSVVAHGLGAFGPHGPRGWIYWNAYMDVDRFPARLWLWTDNPLVNPARTLLRRLAIRARGLATSRTSSALHVVYDVKIPADGIAAGAGPMALVVRATNDGAATWLAGDVDEPGAVWLAWAWIKTPDGLPPMRGHVPLRFDLLPGDSYEFRGRIPIPQTAGRYVLGVDLVAQQIGRFSDHGAEPVRRAITVDTFAALLARHRHAVPDAPRVSVSATSARYHLDGAAELTARMEVGRRAWAGDVYLALEGPDASLRFHDGRQMVAAGGVAVPWIPLARDVRLPPRAHGGGEVLRFPLAGERPGVYTAYLFLAESGNDRIVSDARTRFEVVP